MKRLVGLLCCAFVVGCECNVTVPEEMDAGTAGGTAGGVVVGGGSATAGGASGGGSVTAGGSATAGGAGGGSSTAGGSGGGSSTAGGAGGGSSTAGGSGGGSSTAGGSGGGSSTAGGAGGGFVTAGGAGGGSSTAGGAGGGFVTAGGAGGGSVGGGSAGGSVGGGSAGGSVGGGSAGGSTGPVDTYVCLTCAGSADTNTGAQNNPLRTIARGIAVAQLLGRPTVFVGAALGTATTYSEAVVIPSGIVVQGKWAVSSTFQWARGTTRTNLLNLSPVGVTFAAGAGRTTGLDGFRVISSGALSGATSVAGISIVDASPTILDVTVDPPSGALPPPTNAAGISVSTSGVGTATAAPRIAGLATGSRSAVNAGPATTTSVGISVNGATAEIEFVDARGNTTSVAQALSAGIFMNNAAGTTVRTSSSFSGTAPGASCAGISSIGNSANVVIDGVDMQGCTTVPNGLTPPTASVGVNFTSCPALAVGSVAPRLANSTVRGGVAQGNASWVFGVISNDGCALNIDSNQVTGSNALLVVPQTAGAIVCTHELVTGMAGRNAACRVSNNRGTSGRSLQTSVGLACIGNCGTGNASCTGSCSEVLINSLTGQDSRFVVHALINQSNPRLARNTFGTDAAACTTGGPGGGQPLLIGMVLQGSGSRVENNLIVGGQCPSVEGIEQQNQVRTADNSFSAPTVHSNTIIPAPPGLGTVTSTLIQGVVLRSQVTGMATLPPMGVYRNNIITALGLAAVRFAFTEADAASDAAVMENNDFWAPTVAGMPPLFNNEGTTTLNSAAQINALNGGGVSSQNNLSNDPGFGANYRLTSTSLMRGVGTPTGAPVDDIDGDRRPLPFNTAPDVGCDEVQ